LEYIRERKHKVLKSDRIYNMEFKETIDFKGENFTLIKIQREDLSAIYKSPDGTKYLRLGEENKIKNDLKKHQDLLNLNYPVSEVLEYGNLGDLFFYLERSLGEEPFSTIFAKEYKENGKISNETFDRFFEILKRHFEVQCKNTTDQDFEALWKGILMDMALSERPDLKDRLISRFEKVKVNLKNVPFTFCQGDFNPFNVLPGGVIDFETGHVAPLMFDAFSPAIYDTWFPINEELEISGMYTYTEEQKQRMLNMVDNKMQEYGFGNGSQYYDDTFFLKGVWLAVGLQKWPKFMEWRYKLLESLI
jgi:hypothetical protein